VRLDPRWHQAAARFVQSGFLHILDASTTLFLLLLVCRSGAPAARGDRHRVHRRALDHAHRAASLRPGALWFPVLIEVLMRLPSSTWRSRRFGASLRRR